MKKLLLLFFALATVYTAEAQASFGLRAGGNLSNLSGDVTDDSRFNNKFGWHAGLTANLPIVEGFFSIQPELYYTNKGFRNEEEEFDFDNLTYRREGSVNYNYLELPILARIDAGPLYFEGGPMAAYLLSVNNNTDTFVAGSPEPLAVNRSSTEGLTRFELGYAAGVGFGMQSGISVGVRYVGSFTDFASDAPSDYFQGDLVNARNSVFMLTLGFTFPTR
ncbi:PorT family protein [Pontibacter diazotrophicus]|uniref:PorT family protein n=1 Tax=Pontibacter diazotrophicus TaxID=1400979 RepID=A0A3D8LE46_9BACT|nr:porin family protein [Pontibacter diazotrophicus]RDV15566.1 PorT family protein [Pontibacter diazotrophicus]